MLAITGGLVGEPSQIHRATIRNDLGSSTALGSLLAFYSSAGRNESDNIVVKLAIAMRAHGRGGSLLVVPRNTDVWLDSIVQPITYSVIPPFPDIGTFLQQKEQGFETSVLTLQSAVDALAGLTAVDGATVISDYFEPLAFGAKILSRDGVHRVDQVLLTEPIEGIPDTTVDQRNAIALVASQDGQFTVFAWVLDTRNGACVQAGGRYLFKRAPLHLG